MTFPKSAPLIMKPGALPHQRDAFNEVLAICEVLEFGDMVSVSDECLRNAAAATMVSGDTVMPLTLFTRRLYGRYGVALRTCDNCEQWAIGKFESADRFTEALAMVYFENGVLKRREEKRNEFADITARNPNYGAFA